MDPSSFNPTLMLSGQCFFKSLFFFQKTAPQRISFKNNTNKKKLLFLKSVNLTFKNSEISTREAGF